MNFYPVRFDPSHVLREVPRFRYGREIPTDSIDSGLTDDRRADEASATGPPYANGKIAADGLDPQMTTELTARRIDQAHPTASTAPSRPQPPGIVVDRSGQPGKRGAKRVVKLTPARLREWYGGDALYELLCQLLQEATVSMVRIDLMDVHQLDGDLLTQLARAHCRASAIGKRITVASLTDTLRNIFHDTRFDRMILADDGNGPPQQAFAYYELEPPRDDAGDMARV